MNNVKRTVQGKGGDK